MKPSYKNFGGILFFVSSVVFIFLYLRLGYVGFISDSEIWSVNISKNISTEWTNSWVFTRPLFYTLLSAVVWPFSNPIEIFESAKLLFLINSLFLVVLTGLVTKELASPGWKFFSVAAAICLLLTNTGFLNQGYRIRSDLLASTIVLISLYFTIKFRPQHWYQQIPLWVTPIISTPKAILFILPFFAYPQTKRQKLVVGLALLFSAVTIVFLYPQLLRYLTETVSSGSIGGAYLSRSSFYFVERLIEKNLLFVFLFCLRFMTFYLRHYFNLFDSVTHKSNHLFFTYFTLGVVLALILAPEKNPFFLAAGLPILAAFTSFLFEDFHKIIGFNVRPESRKKFQKMALVCSFVTALAVSASGWRAWAEFMDQNNKFELYKSIQFVEQYLNKYPKARHYDVVGLVPTKTTIMKFAGPNESEGNYWTMHELRKNPPHIIFYVRKGTLLEPELSRLLKELYLPLGGGVYAKWNYFPDWTLVTRKSWNAIEQKILESYQETGAQAPNELFVLMREKNRQPFVLKTGLEELKKRMDKNRAAVLAVTIFEPPGKNPSLLFNIGFDWNQ